MNLWTHSERKWALEPESKSGFDSGSRAHFRSEWVQRFIYFNKIQLFVHIEGDCQCPLELEV